MKKYIVTGGAGFIGSHLADCLIRNGNEVHILDNLSSGKKENINSSAVFHEIDIRDIDKLENIFEGAYGVFHLAAEPRMQFSIENPIETNEINITGTLNVLISAQKAFVKKVVYASSASIYGKSNDMPLYEDVNVSLEIPYAIQKKTGEEYCRMANMIYGIKTVILRFFNVYGPRQSFENSYSGVFSVFLNQIRNGKPMTIVYPGTQRRDFIHVSDVVKASVEAMNRDEIGNGEIINIGSGKSVSINEISNIIGRETVMIKKRDGDTYNSVASIEKAKKLLGWEPRTSIEEGISELKKIYNIN